MSSTQPNNFQWFEVIFMVHLAILTATHLAILLLYLPSFECHFCRCSANSFCFLNRVKINVLWPIGAHIFSVARSTIPVFPISVTKIPTTFRACSCQNAGMFTKSLLFHAEKFHINILKLWSSSRLFTFSHGSSQRSVMLPWTFYSSTTAKVFSIMNSTTTGIHQWAGKTSGRTTGSPRGQNILVVLQYLFSWLMAGTCSISWWIFWSQWPLLPGSYWAVQKCAGINTWSCLSATGWCGAWCSKPSSVRFLNDDEHFLIKSLNLFNFRLWSWKQSSR